MLSWWLSFVLLCGDLLYWPFLIITLTNFEGYIVDKLVLVITCKLLFNGITKANSGCMHFDGVEDRSTHRPSR